MFKIRLGLLLAPSLGACPPANTDDHKNHTDHG